MRFCSSILFSLMAVVLPMAGVQRHFCTMSMAFVDSAEECPVKEKDCCGETEKHAPLEPDCMISAKLLPDAEKSGASSLPLASANWDMLPVFDFHHAPAPECVDALSERDRGPPGVSRLYLAQRRLLI